MSRAKVSYINFERVDEVLKERNILQKELADMIGQNYEALNRALHKGRISEESLERIAIALDVAPEYLADDGSSWYQGAPNNYFWHRVHTENISKLSVLRALWLINGFDPDKLNPEDFWGLWFLIQPLIDQYVESYRNKKRCEKEEE